MANDTDDTEWRAPNVITTPTGPTGIIAMPSTTEETPCFLCKHWERDTRKLMQHIRAKGLIPDANGIYEMPTPDLPGRKSIRVDPKDWGFCLKQGIATHMNAGMQCEDWTQTATRNDLAGKIK